jgi:hypothetical protein
MKQLVSIENITIKRGSGFNIIVHKTGGCRKIAVMPKPQDTTLQWKATI